MTPSLIGIGSGIFLILLFHLLQRFDKRLVYGLILTGIGFIYVGFTWSATDALVINSLQAVFFLLLAYVGIRKSVLLLTAGYFLHGTWDLVYGYFAPPGLVPPHYDIFCLAIDFTIGAYLLIVRNKLMKHGAAFGASPHYITK
jgi:hypothetical protein